MMVEAEEKEAEKVELLFEKEVNLDPDLYHKFLPRLQVFIIFLVRTEYFNIFFRRGS